MSLFVYGCLKSLPAGAVGKGQVYPCANVGGGRTQSYFRARPHQGWVWCALWKQEKKERQERYPTIKTIVKRAGKQRDEAKEGEWILRAWHLDPAGADGVHLVQNKQLLMRGTWACVVRQLLGVSHPDPVNQRDLAH